MKCEICQINQAVRSISRTIEGEERELFVCDSCARKTPPPSVTLSTSTSLTDILFSLDAPFNGHEKVADSVCLNCGISRNEIREKHRLGCPKCYEVFVADIRTFLSAQQPIPPSKGGALRRELTRLKIELDRAIAEERYEDAAKIFEQMRRIGAKTELDDHHGEK